MIYVRIINSYGEVSEWSIVLPWKGSVGSNQPWVRIPPSPQIIKKNYGRQ